MTEVPAAVTLHGVKKAFPLGNGRTLDALNIEHWAVAAGRCTVLTGASGSGKTTLLNLIAGVSLPTAGTILVRDTDISALPEPRRDRFRAQHIGYVFQTFNLLSAFTALENVMRSSRAWVSARGCRTSLTSSREASSSGSRSHVRWPTTLR